MYEFAAEEQMLREHTNTVIIRHMSNIFGFKQKSNMIWSGNGFPSTFVFVY